MASNQIPPDVVAPTQRGQLLANLMHFARALRACGIPIGSGRVLAAVEAVQAVGLANRQDLYWTLHAVFVSRFSQRGLFDQAFHVFWRNPRLLERMMALMLPPTDAPAGPDTQTFSRRLGDALAAGQPRGQRAPVEPPEVEPDAALTWSGREVLREKDFEQMSQSEIDAARAAIARLNLRLDPVATRRYRPHSRGNRIDMRATMRGSQRSGQSGIALVRARRRTRVPGLVVLCDISGSMSRYSRMLLHFVHTLTRDHDRVHSFVFGTRLSNVTRYLRERDVDDALEKVARGVADWSGGTRIGQSLREFNRVWSRRVLSQGAVVLLITDGLDRDVGQGLRDEMDRLKRSCRRLVWLNPLLRYEGFEPRALGMRAMLPYVDELRSVHNLDSLESLVAALSAPGRGMNRSSRTRGEEEAWPMAS